MLIIVFGNPMEFGDLIFSFDRHGQQITYTKCRIFIKNKTWLETILFPHFLSYINKVVHKLNTTRIDLFITASN